ncbi:hypothetical protein FC093_10865 [Ilyomonas limi]|uniref:Uncharacterized protein n=1 Tax=Ilyomonas limi TaxID=2575867 RepID=A0A4V5UUC4_9BACT|nr:hypothetical protein [Ilyomonas limi]TKK68613.1 hypothetical protein FC093_10865 [Ilyomonas limi]
MVTPLLSENVKKAKARYQSITHEIAENKNLPELLRELDEAIIAADDLLVKAILKGSPHIGLEALKNELWYLKFQILERD